MIYIFSIILFIVTAFARSEDQIIQIKRSENKISQEDNTLTHSQKEINTNNLESKQNYDYNEDTKATNLQVSLSNDKDEPDDSEDYNNELKLKITSEINKSATTEKEDGKNYNEDDELFEIKGSINQDKTTDIIIDKDEHLTVADYDDEDDDITEVNGDAKTEEKDENNYEEENKLFEINGKINQDKANTILDTSENLIAFDDDDDDDDDDDSDMAEINENYRTEEDNKMNYQEEDKLLEIKGKINQNKANIILDKSENLTASNDDDDDSDMAEMNENDRTEEEDGINYQEEDKLLEIKGTISQDKANIILNKDENLTTADSDKINGYDENDDNYDDNDDDDENELENIKVGVKISSNEEINIKDNNDDLSQKQSYDDSYNEEHNLQVQLKNETENNEDNFKNDSNYSLEVNYDDTGIDLKLNDDQAELDTENEDIKTAAHDALLKMKTVEDQENKINNNKEVNNLMHKQINVNMQATDAENDNEFKTNINKNFALVTEANNQNNYNNFSESNYNNRVNIISSSNYEDEDEDSADDEDEIKNTFDLENNKDDTYTKIYKKEVTATHDFWIVLSTLCRKLIVLLKHPRASITLNHIWLELNIVLTNEISSTTIMLASKRIKNTVTNPVAHLSINKISNTAHTIMQMRKPTKLFYLYENIHKVWNSPDGLEATLYLINGLKNIWRNNKNLISFAWEKFKLDTNKYDLLSVNMSLNTI